MKKLILSFALVTGLGFAANAQTEGAVKKLSIGAEVGIPTESGSKDFLYVGGSLQAEFPVAKALNLTGSAGYTALTYTGSGSGLSLGFIPVKAGAKYYFGGNFYAAGEVGASISTETGGSTALAFAPALGASFSVADKSSLDFGLRYETWSKNGSTSFLGLLAAYAFGL